MTATKNVYALMLTLVIVLSGCFGMAGDDSDAQDGGDENTNSTNGENSGWINDRGLGNESWSLSLSDDEWLEVKSATGIRSYLPNSSDEFSSQSSMSVIELDDWRLLEGYKGYSPIFGGNYSLCFYWIEGQCFNEDPDGDDDWNTREWSIIYRIHDV